MNMHFGTYANATAVDDARLACVSCPTLHAGRQSLLTLQLSGDNGQHQRQQSNCAALGGDDGNYGLIGFTGM